VQSLLNANSLSLSALLAIIENIELENSIKSILKNDRLSLLQKSIENINTPPSSGFMVGKYTNNSFSMISSAAESNINFNKKPNLSNSPSFYKPTNVIIKKQRISRMKVNHDNLPKKEELKVIRQRKRFINQSIDLFNSNPTKSIQFLKDNNIFSNDDSIFIQQLVKYLRETPSLDKKVIGDFLSSRKNINILKEFINSFDFKNLRIDEALRLFLETFRLPGEAPLISIIMENFAKHWRSSNNEQFSNDDAAFTLAYAIIMLNVDQHNHNVKKQSTPMVVEEFKKNLSKVNGGGNFENELLEEIYYAIKNDEIVMPSEHSGMVRDNYLWKVLIRRGKSHESIYVHAPSGSYNQDIFNIVWGQTISALSFVYDKSFELSVIQKVIAGFK
jgi:brefeldin A-resistance guanine nucleotide exchange factor 1